MARLTAPDEGSRLVYRIDGAVIPVVGARAVFYSDAAGTSLADIRDINGNAVASTLTVDAYSRLPLFQMPDGVDTVYVSVAGGPVTPVYARTDDRLDTLAANVATNTSAISAEATARAAADAAALVAGNGTYALLGFVPDARILPPRPAETVLAAFQSGHGWTQTGVGSSQLNDTGTYAVGSQSIRGTTDGAGGLLNFNSPTLAPLLDLTRKYLKILLRVSDPTNLSRMVVYAANEAGITNSYNFVFTSASGGDEVLIAGDWVEVTLPFSAFGATLASGGMSTSGSPRRDLISNLRVELRDNAAGPITVNINKISVIDEPFDVWPTGLVSFDFDDGYASHATVAGPYLAQYGMSGTTYPICDRLGAGGAFATLAQIQSLQHDLGWAVGVHAFTQANHDAGLTTLTSAAQQAELRAAKNYLLSNGLRADYMAYPRGMFDDTLIGNVRQLCATGRTTYRRYRETWPAAEPYRIRAVSILSTDTLANVKTEIDAAVAGRYWLILAFHDLVAASPTVNQWLQSDFRSLVDYVAASPVAVGNVDQVMRARSVPAAKLGVVERDLADGQESMPRLFGSVSTAPGSGTMRLAYFTARKTEKISSVRANTGTTPASAVTLSRVGLYSVADDGTLTLIGSSANDTAYLSVASTAYTKALSAPAQVYAGKRYAIAPLMVATTTPTIFGTPSAPSAETAIAPRLTGAVTGQADLPNSVAPGSIVTSGFAYYFALLPH